MLSPPETALLLEEGSFLHAGGTSNAAIRGRLRVLPSIEEDSGGVVGRFRVY